jgi:hypothetical protein
MSATAGLISPSLQPSVTLAEDSAPPGFVSGRKDLDRDTVTPTARVYIVLVIVTGGLALYLGFARLKPSLSDRVLG